MFCFPETNVPIEIDNKTYNIDIGNINSISRVNEIINKIDNAQQHCYDDVNWLCDICAEFIDAYLGDGTYEIIFAQRTKNFIQHTALINYILQEIGTYHKNNLSIYSPQRTEE